jgi:TonB dependent receptor/Carboxypeptidase regulatory-like domain/TonB-dependent Receptor Plug Domain
MCPLKQIRLSVFVCALLPLSGLPGWGAVVGAIRGVVHDPAHLPVPDANVAAQSATSELKLTAQTGADGSFLLDTVPIGEYLITVERPGFVTEKTAVTVDSYSTPTLHFQLRLAQASENVEVSASSGVVDTSSMTPTTTIDRHDIDETPGADRTNSLAMITDYVPGAYLAHDQLHIRGGHQVDWLVDGVPVPNTNIASNVGPQFNPEDIDTLEVQRGSYSADFGDRTYGVFNIEPRSGFERDREAELVTSYGNFNQTNDDFSMGDHTERFAWYGSVNGNQSNLGLMTPTSAVLHDQEDGIGGFGTLFYNVTPRDQLRVVGSARRDNYEVPNTPEQQAGGVRDNEFEADVLLNMSWIHTFSEGRLLTVSPFYHVNHADYFGGPNDPDFSTQDRGRSQYEGAQITYGIVSPQNNFRAGLYGYAQQDASYFALSATDGSGTSLAQRISPHGYDAEGFLEDQWKATPWLTLTAGVRLAHFSGGVNENAADPRTGVAIRLPRLGWVVRGFYGRFYQPPPLSTVSGPLLAFALDQGFGFLPLRGERDEEYQFGIAIPWHGWVLDGDHFHMHGTNVFDHDELGNSNIFLPLTISAAVVDAWEVTLRSPTMMRRGHAHLAYSSQRAVGTGNVTGGLTDFSPPVDGLFLLDHDQRHTLNAGGSVNLPWRTWIAGNLYYGSGFPDDEGPARLPEHTTFDLAIGKSFGESWSLSADGINVANRRFLLDNSLTFGGTHYFNPREIYVQLKYRFRF